MNSELLSNPRGQTLVGILVSVGIMGVIVVGLTSIFNFSSKEMRAMNEKLSVLELEKSPITTLADGSVCTFEVTQPGAWLTGGSTPPLTFDASTIGSSNPPTINLNQILVNAAADSAVLAAVDKPVSLNSNSSVIKKIQISEITGPVSGNTFSAKFQVTFDSEKLVRPLKPVYIHQTLLTSGSGAIKTVTGCLGGAQSSGVTWQCETLPPAGGHNLFCVRSSDGTICGTASNGPGNWSCHTPGSWPGSADWRCDILPYSGSNNVSCVRGSDGTICTATSVGLVNWYCRSPGSWAS